MSDRSSNLWEDYDTDERRVYLARNAPDCIFVIGNEKIASFKWILAEISDVFRNMFSGRFVEGALIEIPLPDEDPEAFKKFIYYAHHQLLGKFGKTSLETIMALHQLGDRYNVVELRKVCIIAIRNTPYDDQTQFDDAEWVCAFGFAHHIFDDKIIEYVTKALKWRLQQSDQFVVRCTCIYDWESNVFFSYALALSELFSQSILFNIIEMYAKVWRLVRTEEFSLVQTPEGVKYIKEEIQTAELLPASLEMILRLVDYTKMSLREFRIGPAKSKLLYPAEKLELFEQISKKIPRN